MSDVFTPLTPASLSSGGAATVASSAGVFKSLAANPGGAATSAASGNAACAAKPAVTLQRKGNVVTSIRVQCGCGQVIDINCQY